MNEINQLWYINIIQSIFKVVRSIKKSIRIFPYSSYLLVLFPFFATLINANKINSLNAFVFLVPFILAYASGFAYNTLMDATMDPELKNPVKRGEISRQSIIMLILFLLSISVLLFLQISTSLLSMSFFLVFIFLFFSYSGLNIRLKESYLGPFIASIVLWTGPSFILLVIYNYFDQTLATLLVGIFFVFTGREIRHTLIDYTDDLGENCKTFSVKLGYDKANKIQYLFLVIGSLFIPVCFQFSLKKMGLDSSTVVMLLWLFSILYFITIFLIYRFSPKAYLPYHLIKIILIIYGLMMLNLSPLYAVLILLVILSEKFP